MRFCLFFTVWFCLTVTCIKAQVLQVEHLRNYVTADTCFNKGVSAAFAGVTRGQLIVAGGCNFPHVAAVWGGEKVYYDYIWATPVNAGTESRWTLAGRLPVASAYGITVSDEDGLICLGGTRKDGALKSVYRMEFKGNSVSINRLPDLPLSIDNAAGTRAGSKIYVAGGNQGGKPSSDIYVLDLDNLSAGWQKETTFPGRPRVQAVCATSGEILYIWGGFFPVEGDVPASMPENGWAYNLNTHEWTEVPAPRDAEGNIIALAGGAACTQSDGSIVCVGGVNQEIFPQALNGIHKDPEYKLHPVEWYKFNRNILLFSPEVCTWMVLGNVEEGARAGACLVSDGKWNYIVNGETKPGIRTPLISRFKLEK